MQLLSIYFYITLYGGQIESKQTRLYSESNQGVTIMSEPAKMSLEQKFSLRSFETQVQQMSHEQAQEFLIKLYEQMIVRENMYKEFIKHQWGLEPISQ